MHGQQECLEDRRFPVTLLADLQAKLLQPALNVMRRDPGQVLHQRPLGAGPGGTDGLAMRNNVGSAADAGLAHGGQYSLRPLIVVLPQHPLRRSLP